ncbi:MAG TPA: hypothetical protein VKV04_07440 [Verrucomicrobiae bacterium]|nr:hypothetical protein [Verrucomicrobiae bacterium]
MKKSTLLLSLVLALSPFVGLADNRMFSRDGIAHGTSPDEEMVCDQTNYNLVTHFVDVELGNTDFSTSNLITLGGFILNAPGGITLLGPIYGNAIGLTNSNPVNYPYNTPSNRVHFAAWENTNTFSSAPAWNSVTGWTTNTDAMLITNNVIAHTGGGAGELVHPLTTTNGGAFRARVRLGLQDGLPESGAAYWVSVSTNTIGAAPGGIGYWGDPEGIAPGAFSGISIFATSSYGDTTVVKSNQTDVIIARLGGQVGTSNANYTFVSTTNSAAGCPEIDDLGVNGAGGVHGGQCYNPTNTALELAFLTRVRQYAAQDHSVTGNDLEVNGTLKARALILSGPATVATNVAAINTITNQFPVSGTTYTNTYNADLFVTIPNISCQAGSSGANPSAVCSVFVTNDGNGLPPFTAEAFNSGNSTNGNVQSLSFFLDTNGYFKITTTTAGAQSSVGFSQQMSFQLIP